MEPTTRPPTATPRAPLPTDGEQLIWWRLQTAAELEQAVRRAVGRIAVTRHDTAMSAVRRLSAAGGLWR